MIDVNLVSLRFALGEVVCVLGAVVPAALDLIFRRRMGGQQRSFPGLWFFATGFLFFALELDLMRRTAGQRETYGVVGPWILGLFLAGSASFVAGLTSAWGHRNRADHRGDA
jgi:hypothetical protein